MGRRLLKERRVRSASEEKMSQRGTGTTRRRTMRAFGKQGGSGECQSFPSFLHCSHRVNRQNGRPRVDLTIGSSEADRTSKGTH